MAMAPSSAEAALQAAEVKPRSESGARVVGGGRGGGGDCSTGATIVGAGVTGCACGAKGGDGGGDGGGGGGGAAGAMANVVFTMK